MQPSIQITHYTYEADVCLKIWYILVYFQEVACISWNQRGHHHIHSSPPLITILIHVNPVYILASYSQNLLLIKGYNLYKVLACSSTFFQLSLIRRYNLYKVLACSTTFFQLSLFCVTFFKLRTIMLFISSKTSSSQRVLGLPVWSF